MIVIKKQFIKDVILNIISMVIPLLALQIIALPIVGKKLGSEVYGEIIFLISIFTLISFPFGNVLNNIRLLNNGENNEGEGDYNILVAYSLLLATAMLFIFKSSTDILTYLDFFLLFLIICLTIFKEYYVVAFRIKLNYRAILLNNIFLGFGYLVGTFIFLKTSKWEYIFIFGLIFSNFYIAKNTTLYQSGFERTKKFKLILSDSLQLYFSGLIKNLMIHADKIMLLPLLGPTNVSVYYTASIFSKIIAMFLNPINSVILSYLSRVEKKIKLTYYVLSTSVFGLLFYFLIIKIGPILIELLYPEWSTESIGLLKYTGIIAVITAIAGLFQPFNLRFNKMKWQLYINSSYLIVYTTLTLILTNLFNLKGFVIGVLLASFYNLLIQFLIYHFKR